MLLPWAAACGDDGGDGDGDNQAVSTFFASSKRINNALCTCSTEPDCGFEDETRACTERVVQRHASEVSAFLECVNDVYAELEPCIERASCEPDPVDTCFDQHDIEDQCGDVDDALDEAIEDEIDRECPTDLDCADGSSARGSFCDDVPQCADGSDEDFCESEDQFTCLNGEQVSVSWVCDGADDCGDNSDENPTQCASGGD
jgi:hypothetical protein